MNKELFVVWLKHFVYHVGCTKDKHVLLILDGHSSHTPGTMESSYYIFLHTQRTVSNPLIGFSINL